jgi:hypothetical protein
MCPPQGCPCDCFSGAHILRACSSRRPETWLPLFVEKHSALQEESRALQKMLQERQRRFDQVQAENAQLQQRVKALEDEAELRGQDRRSSCGTSTSQADSAISEAGRDLKEREQASSEILAKLLGETQILRADCADAAADNERLTASLDELQRSKAVLEAQQEDLKKIALEKDAEIEASAKVAEQLKGDLVVARQEKKLIEQVHPLHVHDRPCYFSSHALACCSCACLRALCSML